MYSSYVELCASFLTNFTFLHVIMLYYFFSLLICLLCLLLLISLFGCYQRDVEASVGRGFSDSQCSCVMNAPSWKTQNQ